MTLPPKLPRTRECREFFNALRSRGVSRWVSFLITTAEYSSDLAARIAAMKTVIELTVEAMAKRERERELSGPFLH